MKFTATITDFQKVLQKTLPAMPRKSTLPVLEHLHFSLKGDTLSIISTDQDITIMALLNVTGAEDGSILVPGRRLNDIIKAFGDLGNFDFETNPETFEIKIKIPGGKYGMKGLNPDEYLDLPELFESEKPVVEVKDGIPAVIPGKSVTAYFTGEEISFLCEKTAFAVSKDEFRPAMTGVLFQFKGDMVNAVSTDSYRLSKTTVKSENSQFPNDFSVIIPSRTVELLKKTDSPVVMSFLETMKKVTHTRFDFDDTVMITRVIDEKFPPYEAVIPQTSEYHVVVNHHELVKAIKRVSIFANTNSNQIRLYFDANAIELTSEDEDSGTQGSESINCDYSGPASLIGFNHRYLEEALQNMESEISENMITLNFTETNKPVILKSTNENSNVLMLIMPVRLG